MKALTWNDLKKAIDAMTAEQLSEQIPVLGNGTIASISAITKLETDYRRDFPPTWLSPDGSGELLYKKDDYILQL